MVSSLALAALDAIHLNRDITDIEPSLGIEDVVDVERVLPVVGAALAADVASTVGSTELVTVGVVEGFVEEDGDWLCIRSRPNSTAVAERSMASDAISDTSAGRPVFSVEAPTPSLAAIGMLYSRFSIRTSWSRATISDDALFQRITNPYRVKPRATAAV